MLKQRVDILHEAGMLHKDIHCFLHKLIDHLHDTYPEVSDDTATMFITHIAMATQRVLDDNIAEGMDAGMYQEVSNSTGYDNAMQAMSYIERNTVVAYPESEKQYLILHLCNMFEERRNRG